MNNKTLLVLEDGSSYEGTGFGSTQNAIGEVVFSTSMTGYQEILTDPSYAGQIVIPTYPLIGNYGTNQEDVESNRVQLSGLVVRECCIQPSHYRCTNTLDEYLLSYDVPGVFGLDTRAITRKLRSNGVMMGIITSSLDADHAFEKLKSSPRYEQQDFISRVSTRLPYSWPGNPVDESALRILVLDCGMKYSILRIMSGLGTNVSVVPPSLSPRQILSLKPDGIILSPGPGNPELVDNIVDTVRELADKIPMMGICLGNQLIARAFGAKTYKMKFGHRGGNQPVLELENGHVHITAQNHGFAVDPDTLKEGLEVSFINVNDGTVEGLKHKTLPIFSIQYHSEASPGPLDSMYLFKKFVNMIGIKGAN
ncbi:MAG: glutamine-hydrolyzing carbamoyl-phosphate synthase small subunit [Dehalococcoidales bacterium]|nr:glutamine-hydrolyzing carbamoyl-phosphate synthase small subunit [Dehalococcoidales bacterium]